jgi:anthranilate synthase component 1
MEIILRQKAEWLESDVETVIGLFNGRLRGRDGILLESAEIDGRWGRYSLAAGDFILSAVCVDGRLSLTLNDDRLKPLTQYEGLDYLDGLKALIGALKIEPDPAETAFPPITRALYGYLGYGSLEGTAAEGVFALPGSLYLFDHTYNQLVKISLLKVQESAAAGLPSSFSIGAVSSSLTQADYYRAVSEIKALIQRGEIGEATLAPQFSAPFTGDLFQVYRRLRRLTPSPYLVFMRLTDLNLAVSSPEAMITCEQNTLRLSPLAGSRLKPRSLSEDNLFEDEFLPDHQEADRHQRLVSQGQEELSRVAAPRTVMIDRFMEVERFDKFSCLTSRLSATLAEGGNPVDIVKAVFPAGSVSGAPKRRAMAAIAALESWPRGPFGGAVGWLGLDKDKVSLDLGVTTRGVWQRGEKIFWQIGLNISENSEPEISWREISDKCAAVLTLLKPETPAQDSKPVRPVSLPKPAPLSESVLRLPVLMDNVADKTDLNRREAALLFARLMDGDLSASQAGALLMGLRAKGETAVELAEAARAILDRAVKLPPLPGPFIDIVGTGGDGRNSFNCSTATALTMAGLGFKVVKHGNRSVSSKSGSADVLELLGEDLNRPPESVPEVLGKRNFVFLFAPSYHPSFRHIMPVRKELGIRTIFNILGPLVNPARPACSFLGAPNLATLPLLAGAQSLLGTRLTAIVCGAGGYDEMTALGPATVFLVEGEKITETSIDPARYGFSPCDPKELAIGGPGEGVSVLRGLLAGQGPEPMRNMLILNVAMALYVYKGAESFDDCVHEARRAVHGGAGQEVL